MRQVETLSKWPEYEEFVKADPRRREYVKQAAHARKKRAALKQREMAVRANSGYSRIQGRDSPSTSQVSGGMGEKKWHVQKGRLPELLPHGQLKVRYIH